MEKSTSTDFRCSTICPKCGELQTVVVTVKSELKEAPEAPEKEGETGDGKEQEQGSSKDSAEGDGVRPDSEEGPAGTTSTADKPADSKKSPGTGKAKGK